MRYLPINQIQQDMILGQELYDGRGNLLLPKYTKLTEDHISYIIFHGIWIIISNTSSYRIGFNDLVILFSLIFI